MKPFDYFDAIYCINMDKRPSRWEMAQREFEKLGILDRVERFSGIIHSQPKRGCFESHMKIIHDARENKLNNVFIFEDDVAVLSSYTLEKFTKSINYLKAQEWEFFYMGGLEKRIKPRKRYNRLKRKYGGDKCDENFDYIMKAASVGWNQSYAVNSNIFDKIAEDCENGLWDMLDKRWKGYPGRTDRYYQHHLRPSAYACVPAFTSQYNVPSDLTRTRTNRGLRIDPKDNE